MRIHAYGILKAFIPSQDELGVPLAGMNTDDSIYQCTIIHDTNNQQVYLAIDSIKYSAFEP